MTEHEVWHPYDVPEGRLWAVVRPALVSSYWALAGPVPAAGRADHRPARQHRNTGLPHARPTPIPDPHLPRAADLRSGMAPGRRHP